VNCYSSPHFFCFLYSSHQSLRKHRDTGQSWLSETLRISSMKLW